MSKTTITPAAAALLAEAARAYGTPAERAVRAAQADDAEHNVKVSGSKAAQAMFSRDD